jgi:hypothetical protein
MSSHGRLLAAQGEYAPQIFFYSQRPQRNYQPARHLPPKSPPQRYAFYSPDE